MPWPVASRYHAAPVPIIVAARIVPVCRRRGARFWTETAIEYTSAKALSVSSTRITRSGRRPNPTNPIAARQAVGSPGFIPGAVNASNARPAPRKEGGGVAQHDEFECRPAEELHDSHRGRDVGPGATEYRAEADHRRYAGAAPMSGGARQQRAPDDGSREGDEDGLP